MKGLKGCKEYKEQVMEAIDGLITKEGKAGLNTHINACTECRKYLKNMEKIRKTVSAGYEVPPYLEAKIMAKITGKTKQPAWQPGLRPVLSFAASFGLVMLLSLFIIYRSFDNKTVTVADMPFMQEKAVAVKPEIRQVVKETAPDVKLAVVNPAEQEINTVSKTQPEINRLIAEKEHGPALKLASNTSETAVTAQKNDVVKTGEASGLVMLKPGVIPTTTDNPLLDKDLAIVANNLINPLRGEFATIIIKVIEPATVKIIIYDKSVRPVSKILDSFKDRGTYEATWEGRTDNGETVSEGVYFVYIQIGTRVIKKSIIVNK
jgi:hypothetical protein